MVPEQDKIPHRRLLAAQLEAGSLGQVLSVNLPLWESFFVAETSKHHLLYVKVNSY
jgi:hypothetical protein